MKVPVSLVYLATLEQRTGVKMMKLNRRTESDDMFLETIYFLNNSNWINVCICFDLDRGIVLSPRVYLNHLGFFTSDGEIDSSVLR